MIVASGIISVDREDKVDGVVDELKKRSIMVDDIDMDKIIFLIEAETVDIVRSEIERLRHIEHVRDVQLLFYSFEDTRSGDPEA
jgi:nitrate reductase NapAB chaperone NapD